MCCVRKKPSSQPAFPPTVSYHPLIPTSHSVWTSSNILSSESSLRLDFLTSQTAGGTISCLGFLLIDICQIAFEYTDRLYTISPATSFRLAPVLSCLVSQEDFLFFGNGSYNRHFALDVSVPWSLDPSFLSIRPVHSFQPASPRTTT